MIDRRICLAVSLATLLGITACGGSSKPGVSGPTGSPGTKSVPTTPLNIATADLCGRIDVSGLPAILGGAAKPVVALKPGDVQVIGGSKRRVHEYSCEAAGPVIGTIRNPELSSGFFVLSATAGPAPATEADDILRSVLSDHARFGTCKSLAVTAVGTKTNASQCVLDGGKEFGVRDTVRVFAHVRTIFITCKAERKAGPPPEPVVDYCTKILQDLATA